MTSLNWAILLVAHYLRLNFPLIFKYALVDI